MPLTHLRIKALRCLIDVELDLHAQRNYLFGPNGAGKTSLLESVYLLGRGRSFRTRQIRKLVRHGMDGFAVYGEVEQQGRLRRLGVALEGGRLEKRIDGDSTVGMAALAEALPVHVIDPGAHLLIEGGPSERRRFLDWGVFHVEPEYLDGWRRYRRLLGQRNAALKNASVAELRTWSGALVTAGDRIHNLRLRYMERLAPAVENAGRQLLSPAVRVEYRAGWAADQTFEEALRVGEPGDRASGNTQVGPHRADLEITLDTSRVRDEASRGQQKMVAAALVLGQLQVNTETRNDRGMLLVDDPAAELDRPGLERLLAALESVPAQLLLTGLSPTQLAPRPEFPVFHVERGNVKSGIMNRFYSEIGSG